MLALPPDRARPAAQLAVLGAAAELIAENFWNAGSAVWPSPVTPGGPGPARNGPAWPSEPGFCWFQPGMAGQPRDMLKRLILGAASWASDAVPHLAYAAVAHSGLAAWA